MSFTEHLGELRIRLIRSGGAVVVGVIICYVFSNQIFEGLSRPIRMLEKEIAGFEILPDAETPEESDAPAPETAQWVTLRPDEPYVVRLKVVGQEIAGVQVIPEDEAAGLSASWTVLNPLEPIIVKFKIAGYGGLFLAMPFILFQLCAFIFPGLRPNEKKAAQYLIFGCTVLAFTGVAVAYFLVFPFVLPYLAQFVPEGVEIQLRMNETISMLVKGLLGFGIAFQFPMAVLILVYVGVLDPLTLRQYRKVVIVFLAIGSAILTPPDPVTMSFMLIPLCLLYEGSIWLSYLVVRRRASAANA
ncbi:MAG: twin-arginine translocase subunit TatC [Candidatus Hydrogenedentes bacterium]|nr:twin-arginine translocase subunit TatC [Candidatus Hydrogenedentota bacterium]